jgi:hypothetical protein
MASAVLQNLLCCNADSPGWCWKTYLVEAE